MVTLGTNSPGSKDNQISKLIITWTFLLCLNVLEMVFYVFFLLLSFFLGLDKLRASEPASHASRASESCESCESSCVPCETDVSSQSVFLSSAFGYRIWHEFSLSSLSFCYLPSSFSSFVKVSFVLFCCRSILRLDVLFMSVVANDLKFMHIIYMPLQIHGKSTSAKPPGGQ